MNAFVDSSIFFVERVYNRSLGKILNWDHESITLLSITFMLKSNIDAIYSPSAKSELYSGLTHDEILEVKEMFELVSVLPKPGLPNGTFSERQKLEYGITLIANTIYMFRK